MHLSAYEADRLISGVQYCNHLKCDAFSRSRLTLVSLHSLQQLYFISSTEQIRG